MAGCAYRAPGRVHGHGSATRARRYDDPPTPGWRVEIALRLRFKRLDPRRQLGNDDCKFDGHLADDRQHDRSDRFDLSLGRFRVTVQCSVKAGLMSSTCMVGVSSKVVVCRREAIGARKSSSRSVCRVYTRIDGATARLLMRY